MKNVYDIRREKNLIYILPEKAYADEEKLSPEIYSQTAIIIYMYYIESLPEYYKYIENISHNIDIYIVSSREEVLEEVRKHLNLLSRQKVWYILKENRGRDVSALLIVGREIVSKYKYVCFLHDKKEHNEGIKKDTLLWIENLWGNQIGSPNYIDSVLKLFENNKDLGILAPPEPVGDNFDAWYGYGWYKSYDITKNIADRLCLNADLDPDKPPITFGTVLWFRSCAMLKLFDIDWKYDDFDDEKLSDENYLSYGIERIFAYVAQDAGYDTGTSMTVSYAEKQMGYVQYAIGRILREADSFFPISFSTIESLNRYIRNREKITAYTRNNKRVYLYGTGKMSRFCISVLREENALPVGCIVSSNNDITMLDGIPVFMIDEIDHSDDIAIIITVYDPEVQKEIAEELERRGFCNYIKFWD